MAAFNQALDTVDPSARETLSPDQIEQLQAVFMEELMTNQVIMQALEEKLRQALAEQSG